MTKPGCIRLCLLMLWIACTTPAQAADFEQRDVEGWTVYVNQAALKAHPEVMDRALALLSDQLYQIARCMPRKTVDKLRTIPLWVEYETKTSCMSYHPARQWLLDHGYDPPRVPSVIELGNAVNFLSWIRQQPWMVLHELAHGYNHLILAKGAGYAHAPIDEAYARAKKKGVYDEVMHIVQAPSRHYAMQNMMEYFAEGTEAFFGTNDFYPFVRAELKEEDPHLHKLLARLWDAPAARNTGSGKSPWYALRHKGCVTGWEPADRESKDTGHPSSGEARKAAGAGAAKATSKFTPSKEYEYHALQGFEVYVSPEVLRREKIAGRALRLLDHQLRLVARHVPEPALEKIRKTPIWLEYKSRDVAYVAYHASRAWLDSRGLNPDKTQSIEIGHVEKYLDWADLQPGLMMHLLAHAYHDRVVGFEDPYVMAAFEQAEKKGNYASVLRYDGRRDRHFALFNALEYFAEASEAFFCTNDYYPFVQPELREHDLPVYGLMEKLWEGPPRRK